MQFQQDYYHIERKEHRDKNLWHFFFVIYAIFVVKSLWLRLAALGRMRHLHKMNISSFPSTIYTQSLAVCNQAQSNLIKPNQDIFEPVCPLTKTQFAIVFLPGNA
jgi:hypothetical protein